jgi:hypothetical protein
MHNAIVLLRAYYRDFFILTATLLAAAPVAVVLCAMAASVMKGPQP